MTFRYFYDDANELFRVLDSTGTLIEYIYDPSGNITKVNRSTVSPSAVAILNITPLTGAVGSNVTIYGQNFSASAA
jgi:YD repeat-containing protein